MFDFGYLSFTADASRHLIPAAIPIEGCSLFVDLTEKLISIQICDEPYISTTYTSFGQPLGSSDSGYIPIPQLTADYCSQLDLVHRSLPPDLLCPDLLPPDPILGFESPPPLSSPPPELRGGKAQERDDGGGRAFLRRGSRMRLQW